MYPKGTPTFVGFTPRNVAPVFNVRDFGAKGDGATDDTAAINAAIEAARLNAGGTVFFPPGEYRFTSLTLGKTHQGINFEGSGIAGHPTVGNKGTTLASTLTDATPAITLAGTAATGQDAYTNAVWRNLTLTAVTKAGSGHGFKLENLGHVMFVNVDVRGYGGDGFNCVEVNTCTWDGVNSEQHTGNGITLSTNCHSNTFQGQTAFKNCIGWGVHQSNGSNGASFGNGLVISGNQTGGMLITNAKAWFVSGVYFESNVNVHVQLGNGASFPKAVTLSNLYLNSIGASTAIGIAINGGAAGEPYRVHVDNCLWNGSYATARVSIASFHAVGEVTGISGFDFANWTDTIVDASGAEFNPPLTHFRFVGGCVIESWRGDRLPHAPRVNAYFTGGSGNHAQCASSAALNPTGDITLVGVVAPADWDGGTNRTIVSKLNSGGYEFYITTAGALAIIWNTGGGGVGATSTATLAALANNEERTVAVTLDVDNGASGYSVRFWHSTNRGKTWTQLGSTVTAAGVTSIATTTQLLTVGVRANGTNNPFIGRIDSVSVRDGIGAGGVPGGTEVASPSFAVPWSPRYRDAQGNVWSFTGSAWAWAPASVI